MLRFLVLVVLFRLSECKVRLVGGSTSSEGRVEIFHNGRWGTICDDSWDVDDARVVCRSLGLPDAISATTLANFGQGSGEILLDEVDCRGNELSLSDCRHDGWGENNCGHGEDAGVVCGHPDVVNINVSSLFGVITSPGYPQHMQRANYEWTFRPPIPNPNVIVCFDDLDLRTYSDGSFRATVQDSSNTELFSLKNSKHKEVCVIMESAGGKVTFYASLTPPIDDRGKGFRMRYAAVDRLQAVGFCSNSWEISAKGEAGRIDLSWKPPPKKSKSAYKYIVMYNTSASNVRTNLASSTSVVINNLDPSREYFIRVIAIPLANEQSSALYSCTKRIRTKKEQSRVTDGKSDGEGYVQVYHAGQWTRICDNYWWDINDANVACRSMGLVAAKYAMVTYPKITKNGQQILLGNSISKLWLSGLRCTGREKSLLGCPTIASLGWTKFCYNDAGLVCKTPPVPSIWRLFDGMFPNEGLLEVYHNGEWGRVCSRYGWNMNSAKVACRSLGLPAPPFVLKYVGYWRPKEEGSRYIRPERKTWIKDPSCDGIEKSLANCQNGEMKESICRYSTGYLNLVCGLPKVQQIYINDTSGMITSPGHPWYTKQAHVKWIFKPAVSADAKVLLYFDMMDLRRNYPVSNERTSLSIHDGINTTLFYMENKLAKLTAVMGTSDAIVSFFSSFTYVYGGRGLRRTGFRMRYLIVDKPCHENWNISVQVKPGRILVNWDAIDDNSGHRDLKYKYLVMYNSTTEPIKTVLTSGTSVDIDYLPPNTLYSVGVLAYPSDATKNSSVFYFCSVKDFHTHKATTRLVGGKTPFEGHIQVFHQGIWGTICEDKDYDVNDARVACRSMGLPDVTYYKTYLMFGRGKEKKKWLRALKCKGNETSLGDCKHAGWGNTRWCYNYDAGVVCGNPSEQHFTITNSAGAITSPGFSDYMPMMHHVYHFQKPATVSNAKLILYLDTIWLDRKGNKGERRVSVIDRSGSQLLDIKNGKTYKRTHVLIQNNPSKLSFFSPFTVENSWSDKGFRMRYFVFNESCKGNWNITVQKNSGNINISWSLLDHHSNYTHAVVYYSTSKNINLQTTRIPSVMMDYLEPNTEYTIRLFAFVPKSKELSFCSRRVRTEAVQWRIVGGELDNEGVIEVNYKSIWGAVCADHLWDLKDASVACRYFGLPKATYAPKYGEFRTENTKFWLNYLQCLGNETSLENCYHRLWKSYNCLYPAGVVCGDMTVERHNITDHAGFIISPGYPHSMIQAHHEWTFIPANQNTKVLVEFLRVDLKRYLSGKSEMKVEDNKNNLLLSVKNTKLDTRQRFLVNKPTKMTYFSSFSSKYGGGIRMRYVMFDDSCSSNWSINVKPGIGKMDVSWTPQSSDSEYNYLIVYNGTFNKSEIVDAHFPGATIDYLPPNTVYKVTVLALHKNNTVTKHCTRYVRTKPEPLRVVGGRIPSEGRVEIYNNDYWGVICEDDWDMKDARVACRQAGFPPPTWVFEYSPFLPPKKRSTVLGPLQCNGSETSIFKCPVKREDWCFNTYPASLVCGKPAECKTEIQNSLNGLIQWDDYFNDRKVECEWTITAPTKSSPIIVTLKKRALNHYSPCSKNYMIYVDALGREVKRYCKSSRELMTFVAFGFLKIRLRSDVSWYRVQMNAKYFISSNKLDDFVNASNWFITAQSKTPGAIEVTWPQYKPRDEKSQNFKQVVKYVPVCVAHKDGDVITADSFSGNTKATFNKLPYGEYTVYVLAYLSDHSRNTAMTNWNKAARRSRSVILKTMEGYPSQPPMNVTATSTGTSSILVTWQPIPEEYANGILMGYEIYYGHDEKFLNAVVKVKNYDANSTSFEIKDISDQTKYYIRVRGFTKRGVGPASPKVSATTGYEVRLTKRYGGFHALGSSSDLSKAHTVWKLGPIGEEFDEILIVFKTLYLESSGASCSNNYVQVTDANDKEIGTFCGKKIPFATSIPKGSGVAQVTLRINTVPDRGSFSWVYKVINEQPSNKSSVWNLKVQNTFRTGAEVSWDIPDGNVSDIMVLFKESSVQYTWQAVKASPLDNSFILKDLVSAKQYHVRLVGSIFNVIQESKLMTFTTMGDMILTPKPTTAANSNGQSTRTEP